MTVTKIHIIAVITAIVVIATSTTMTGFSSVSTVFASSLTFGPPELVSDDTTTNATTSSETAGQQQPVHITKDGTNSYIISGTMASIGSFDTTYRIAGERSAIRAAENLIINVIAGDFNSSRTIGYVRAANMTTTATGVTPEPTLPSPFASPEQITERITTELRRAITEAESNTPQGQHVEIKCDFGMSLEEMRCHHVPLAGTGGGGAGGDLAATTPTDSTAPIAPLEGQ